MEQMGASKGNGMGNAIGDEEDDSSPELSPAEAQMAQNIVSTMSEKFKEKVVAFMEAQEAYWILLIF